MSASEVRRKIRRVEVWSWWFMFGIRSLCVWLGLLIIVGMFVWFGAKLPEGAFLWLLVSGVPVTVLLVACPALVAHFMEKGLREWLVNDLIGNPPHWMIIYDRFARPIPPERSKVEEEVGAYDFVRIRETILRQLDLRSKR